MSSDPIALTRSLVDIESITYNEAAAGEFTFEYLNKSGFRTEKMPVEGKRFNVYAQSGRDAPAVVLSTHMDTVPPFIPSSEDEHKIYGRGSCDAKGIMAAQIAAAEKLRAEGVHVGLLFVVGEERDSLGAKVANEHPKGSRFLINGEPTENRVALASKGALRVGLKAEGKMAHSAYPELGESAIDKLVEALHRIQKLELPVNPEIGPSTANVGLIEGGRAPNVIPDHAAAEILVRLVGPSEAVRKMIIDAVGSLVKVEFNLEIPFVKLRTFSDLPTMVAKYTTDIPALTAWGEPLLFGPGSIHVAHTTGEFIPKSELIAAVDVYCRMVKGLLA